MDLTTVIVTSAVTALVTSLVALGVTSGIPRLWKRLTTPPVEWTVTRDTAGRWTLRRAAKRTALDTTFMLGHKGGNVSPNYAPIRFEMGVDVEKGVGEPVPEIPWDEITVSWIENNARRSAHAYVLDPDVSRVELLRGSRR